MMQFQLRLNDPESILVIQESQNLNQSQLIDIMRMVNATFVGFIALEESGLLTLPRSTDDSFAVMLEALFVAIEHIGSQQN